MIDLRSVWRGMLAMRRGAGPVKWRVRRVKRGYPLGSTTKLRPFWCEAWTPIWHDGRGPYLSLGLGVFAVYRGY